MDEQRPFNHHSFQQFLNEHRLMGSRSASSGEVFLPPRPLDPSTYREDMEWVELSGEGRLVAYTAVHIGPTAMIEAGYDRKNPYVSGVVELVEGPKISAQILGVDATNPAAIAVGTPLRVTFVDRGKEEEKRTFLAFEVID